jgi:hypothetical protein
MKNVIRVSLLAMFYFSMLVGMIMLLGMISAVVAAEDDAATQEAEIKTALAELAPEDRRQAELQRYCPIMESIRLGAMGSPVKVTVNGKSLFLCCAGCKKKALSDPTATATKVEKLKKAGAVLAKLPANERGLAETQRFCVVMGKSPLGSMGAPVKLMIEGKPVFLCCEGCRDEALANPKETLTRVTELTKVKTDSSDSK